MTNEPQNDGLLPAEELGGFVSEEGRPEHNIADEQQEGTPQSELIDDGAGHQGTRDESLAEKPDDDGETLPDAEKRIDATRRNIDGLAPGTGVPPEDVSGYAKSPE